MGEAVVATNALKERFWSGVQPADDDKCWPWMRCCTTKGYGQLSINNRSYPAHRTAFFLAHGHWPNVICHTCDNPLCCNPKHLINGTYKLNMQHRSQRGRHNCQKGEHCGRAKLKDAAVLSIREAAAKGITQSAIARQFSCSQAMVSNIVTRKHWKHI